MCSAQFGWSSVHVERRLTVEGGEMDAPVAFDNDILIVHRRRSPMWQKLDGMARIVDLRAGTTIAIPRDTGVQWRWRRPAETVTLQLRDDHDHPRSWFQLPPEHLLHDPFVAQAAAWLGEEVSNGNVRGPLFVDGIGIAVAAHLRSLWPQPEKIGRCAALDPRRLTMIHDYMNDRISTRIGIEELAHIVGMSRSHFSRSFKSATGITPHRYLMDLRIRRALNACAAGRDTLAMIAADCGFADQAHMSRLIKRQTGHAPTLS
ncbi:MAG: helix-turn-helix domain-containing protein [Sphingorhabdus sp.]